MTTESMLSSIKSSLGAAMRGRIFTCSFASGSMIPLACQYLSLLECIFFNAFSLILATSLSDIFSASSWLRRYYLAYVPEGCLYQPDHLVGI